MRNEMIIVQFVSEHIYADTKGKEIKYKVQVAGVSDKPSKLMKLQVWDIDFDTSKEARETLEKYQENMKKGRGSFIIVIAKNIKN